MRFLTILLCAPLLSSCDETRGSGAADVGIIFMGDSITFAAMKGECHPSLSEILSSKSVECTYANAAVSGSTSVDGLALIDRLLFLHPGARYVMLCYGRNDIDSPKSSEEIFRSSMQAMVDKVRACGKIPVIPSIPYSLHPFHARQEIFNLIALEVASKNQLDPGPDFYQWFLDHPDEISEDLSHPNGIGNLSINRLWAECMLKISSDPAQ